MIVARSVRMVIPVVSGAPFFRIISFYYDFSTLRPAEAGVNRDRNERAGSFGASGLVHPVYPPFLEFYSIPSAPISIWGNCTLAGVLIPDADWSATLDQAVASKPNPQWAARRNSASRFRRRSAVIASSN